MCVDSGEDRAAGEDGMSKTSRLECIVARAGSAVCEDECLSSGLATTKHQHIAIVLRAVNIYVEAYEHKYCMTVDMRARI